MDIEQINKKMKWMNKRVNGWINERMNKWNSYIKA